MSLISANDVKFLRLVEDWLRCEKEVLVQIDYAYAAGDKSFEFFISSTDLVERLRNLSPRTRITAFKKLQLCTRGCVDDEFIGECLRRIPDGSEFLVVETVPTRAGKATWFQHEAGTSHQELQEALADSRGKQVAVSEYPQPSLNCQDSITVYVPDKSGEIRTGAY